MHERGGWNGKAGCISSEMRHGQVPSSDSRSGRGGCRRQIAQKVEQVRDSSIHCDTTTCGHAPHRCEGLSMIKVGEKLPGATVFELIEDERAGCTIGPNSFDVRGQTAGKRVVIFGLPGAFTPTCSAKHVPGYVEHAEQLRVAGIDEIWCVSVND